MKPEGFSPYSQAPATCPYPEPAFPDLGSYIYALLDFCVTHIRELAPHMFGSSACFIHTSHNVFHEAQLYVQRGQINFLRKNKRRNDDIFLPWHQWRSFRPQLIYIVSDSSCRGCPTCTGNSSILCNRVACRVTVPQPSDHHITST